MTPTQPVHVTTSLGSIWGARVAHRRGLLNLTQAQLAEIAGVRQQTISRIESGRNTPSDTLKIRLARSLGEELSSLFAWPELRDVAA